MTHSQDHLMQALLLEAWVMGTAPVVMVATEAVVVMVATEAVVVTVATEAVVAVVAVVTMTPTQ